MKQNQTIHFELLTITQASEYLKIIPSTIRSMCFYKKIPFIKIGRMVRFDKNQLNDWLMQKSELR